MRGVLLVSAVVCVLAVASHAAGVAAPAGDDDLPDGEGKKILIAACTTCHELNEVTKFKGYYTRVQWRDIVITMKEYGAQVDERQVDVLTDYLNQTLGKK